MTIQFDDDAPSLSELEDYPPSANKALHLAHIGLFVDGGHHKQWFLESILEALGVDLDELRAAYEQDDEYEPWEPGIAP